MGGRPETQKDRIHGRAGGGHHDSVSSPCVLRSNVSRRPARARFPVVDPRHSKGDGVSGLSLRPLPLEQPQRLVLLLVCPSLGGPGLRRRLPTPVLTPGRGSGSLISRMLWCVFPPGSRPFDHRTDGGVGSPTRKFGPLVDQHAQATVAVL